MDLIQTASTVIGLLATAGITVQTIMFRRANKRIKDAEAKTAEVNADTASTNNAILATNEWKDIAVELRAELKERETKIDELNARIGSQFDTIGQWRDKYLEEQKAHHATQLELKDAQMQLAEEKWHRCEVNGCTKRVPPRSRTEKPNDNG